MKQYVVLCWYYNERDGRAIIPELSGAYGPFVDIEAANAWISTASKWGGWGRYEHEVTELYAPKEPE